MAETNRKIIAGVEFEGVRMANPCFHWRARVVKTGYVYDAGCFKSESRPKLWDSIEYTATRIGAERFAKEALDAH